MKVEMQIDDALKQREDLIQILKAAADFLASRDTDTDSEAIARWRLWRGEDGEPRIGLDLQDHDYSSTGWFAAKLLAPAEDRELRLVHLWNKVLRERTRREIEHTNQLISQYEGE